MQKLCALSVACQVFWSQLADRLAARDLAAESAALHPRGPADEAERLTRLFELTERYETLLAESGLDSIGCTPERQVPSEFLSKLSARANPDPRSLGTLKDQVREPRRKLPAWR
jgi:hypothetical protein